MNSSLKSNTKFGINLLYFWLSLPKIPQSEVLYALHTVTQPLNDYHLVDSMDGSYLA